MRRLTAQAGRLLTLVSWSTATAYDLASVYRHGSLERQGVKRSAGRDTSAAECDRNYRMDHLVPWIIANSSDDRD